MERTSLVVGGFTQPIVARSMIEQPGSTEKGLAQRFLWLFPQPVFEDFSKLEPISEIFTEKIGNLLLYMCAYTQLIFTSEITGCTTS